MDHDASGFSVADVSLPSRLLLGTARYPSLQCLADAVQAIVVVAVEKPQALLKTEKGRNRNEYCIHFSKISSASLPANLILALTDY